MEENNNLAHNCTFTTIKEEDFTSANKTALSCTTGIVFTLIWLFFVIASDFDSGFYTFLAVIFIILAFCITHFSTKDEVEALERKKKEIKKNNRKYISESVKNLLIQNGFINITKEIFVSLVEPKTYSDVMFMEMDKNNNELPETKVIDRMAKYYESYRQEKFVVDEETSLFGHIYFQINETDGQKNFFVNKAKFNELLKYEVIDKTTSTQIATSTTSSNSGKAIGGAIVSQLLIGNSTTGAVIGGSGKRTTETTYKTNIKEKYQMNIYVNNLQNSIIKIESSSRDKISEIIAILEYILKNQNGEK